MLVLGRVGVGVGGQRRYCVKRSKQQYRDLDSQAVSQDGETKQEKTEMLTHTHSLRGAPVRGEALLSDGLGATHL